MFEGERCLQSGGVIHLPRCAAGMGSLVQAGLPCFGYFQPSIMCVVLIQSSTDTSRDRPYPSTPNMSTAVWPPIDAQQLASEQQQSQQRELEWLLVQLKETLQSLKAGLEECAALLAPSENGSTLVLTSVRSESLKGLVTRIGTRIVKGVRCSIVCL